MRLTILIACLVSFTFSCFHSHAGDQGHHHYVSSDHDHGHSHSHGHDDCEKAEAQTQDEDKQSSCGCCAHSHCMAVPLSPVKMSMLASKQQPSWYMDSHYSTDLSGLKHPPRL